MTRNIRNVKRVFSQDENKEPLPTFKSLINKNSSDPEDDGSDPQVGGVALSKGNSFESRADAANKRIAFGKALINDSITGEGFDPQGGWGVAAAQIANAGIGAWAQNRGKRELAEIETGQQQQYSKFLSDKGYTPESAEAISAMSSQQSRAVSIAGFIKQELKASNPEAQSSLGKLSADYKAGLVDESTYRSAMKKETSFAPQAEGGGGAAGFHIRKLREENPNLTYDQALRITLSGARNNQTFSDSGEIMNLPGTTGAKSALKAAEAEGGEVGKDRGEAKASLTFQEAKLPELENTVKELSTLGKAATYTKAGQARDFAARELGLEAGPGAVARSAYIAKVDNVVLPLLKQTFGAAFTKAEGESLKVTLGDPNKSPKEKDAVVNEFIKQKRSSIESTKRQIGGSEAAPNKSPDLKSKYGLK